LILRKEQVEATAADIYGQSIQTIRGYELRSRVLVSVFASLMPYAGVLASTTFRNILVCISGLDPLNWSEGGFVAIVGFCALVGLCVGDSVARVVRCGMGDENTGTISVAKAYAAGLAAFVYGVFYAWFIRMACGAPTA